MIRGALISILCLVGVTAFSFGAQGDDARVVLATIYFKNGSADLNPEYENDLKKVQAALKADPTIGLQIEAYNANRGSAENNREISQKSAQAVRQWFLKNNIDPSRLMIKRFDDSRSAAQNDTSKDDSLNRRIEIVKILLKLPSAYLPAARYEFPAVVEGQQVSHNFVIQNKGAAPLEVQKVKTDWGCTAVSYTRQIPPGGEGQITLKVNTKGYGGRKVSKSATVYTNDKRNSKLKLSIFGNVEKFVRIQPRQIRLRGYTGEPLKRKVTIIPLEKYPFKILKVRAKNGKEIRFQLQEEKSEKGLQYALTIENQRLEKGRYFDIITLETDSKIKPTLSVRVYGDIKSRSEEKKKKNQ